MGCITTFLSVFYLIGFGMLGYGVWNARRSTQAASWPTTPGTIRQLSISEHFDDEGTTYEVKVQYTYTVNGVTHEGSRLAFGYVASGGKKIHDDIYQKLKGVRTVAVRYDPSDPSVSCLSFGLHRSIQLMLAFAITWLAFIFGLTLFMWLFSRGDGVLLDNLAIAG